MPAQQGGWGDNQGHARQVGQLGGEAGEDHLLPARRPGLLGLVLVEPQLLPEQDDLDGLVVVAAPEGVEQVEQE